MFSWRRVAKQTAHVPKFPPSLPVPSLSRCASPWSRVAASSIHCMGRDTRTPRWRGSSDVETVVNLFALDVSSRFAGRIPEDDCNARERRSEPQPPAETVSCTGQYHGVARRVKRRRIWRSVHHRRTVPLVSRGRVLGRRREAGAGYEIVSSTLR